MSACPSNSSNSEDEQDWTADDSILTISWHKEPVYAVDCHPQLSNTFLSASGDGTACLWKLEDWSDIKPYHTVEESEDSRAFAKFSPDGTMFATASLDGSVQVFDASSGSLVFDLVGPSSSVEFIRWFQDSSCLIAGCSDQTAWIWSMSDASPLNVFATNSPVTCGCLFRQDEYVVLGMEDGSISVFQSLTVPQVTFPVLTSQGSSIICLESTSQLVASGVADGHILLIQPETGRILARTKPHNDSVESIDFSSSYPWLVSASTDATVSVWDLERSVQRYQWRHEGAVVKVQWLNRNYPFLVLSASADNTLCLWDIRTATNNSCVKTFHGHSDTILDFSMTNDEQIIVTGCDDNDIRLFMLQE